MKFEITGNIYKVFDTKQISERFTKREFVLSVEDGRYSQMLLFEMTGDKVTELDGYQNGDEVTVHFNVRGREWKPASGETKYFNSLNAWKVERYKPKQAPPPVAPPPADDGLPF